MPRNLKNKIFLLGIFTMIILLSIPQNTIASKIDIDNEKQENYQVSPSNNDKGEWKTNYYCRINVYVDGGCYCQPELGLFFVRNARITGNIVRCSISGTNGTDVFESGRLDLRVQYLFGFCRFFWQSWLSWAEMRGFAIKCWYKIS